MFPQRKEALGEAGGLVIRGEPELNTNCRQVGSSRRKQKHSEGTDLTVKTRVPRSWPRVKSGLGFPY